MIPVSLSLLVCTYLFLFCGIVFGIWLWFGWRRQLREKKSYQYRVRCQLCAYDFEDPTQEPLPRCPSCGSLNERLPYQAL